MRELLTLIPLLAFLATPAHQARADRCGRTLGRCVPAAALGLSDEELVRRRRDGAERVVLGRVTRVDTLAPRIVGHGPDQIAISALAARVGVSRIWKGPAVDTLTVVFGTTGIMSSCDLALEPGASYVIFASRAGDGLLATRQCTGTASEDHATATISALGPGQKLER